MYKISAHYFKSIRPFQFYIIHLNPFKCSMFINSKTNLSILSHQFKLTININHLMMRKTIANKNLDSIKCWNCNEIIRQEKSIVFCHCCKSLQPLNDDAIYYDIFDIPISFDVDLNKLNQKHKQLQMVFHPDHFHGKNQQEHQYSLATSIIINRAYNTLRNPYRRGLYLLQIKYNQSIGEGDINYGSDFLEEMMQLNEKLESNDMTENELAQLEKDNQLLIKKMTSQISDAFKCDNFAKAKEILIKMKFYISYGDKLKELFARKFM